MTASPQELEGQARTYRKAFFREEALQARRAYSGNQFAPRRRRAVRISLLFLTLCAALGIAVLTLPALSI